MIETLIYIDTFHCLKGSVEAGGLVIDELKLCLDITAIQAVALVSFQITNMNFMAASEKNGAVRSEADFIWQSHKVLHQTLWQHQESLAGPGQRISVANLSHKDRKYGGA